MVGVFAVYEQCDKKMSAILNWVYLSLEQKQRIAK